MKNINGINENNGPTVETGLKKKLMFEENIMDNITIDEDQLHKIVMAHSKKKQTMTQDINRYKSKYFMALFVIGALNQIGYNLTQNSAQNIADKFGYSNLIAIFQTVMILMGFSSILVSSFYMIHVEHKVRVKLVVLFQLTSLLMTALANMTSERYGFWICVVSSGIIGMAQGLGEASVIGFLQTFPPFLVGFFSSGTGMGGISASLFYLLMQTLSIPDKYSYLIMIPINTIPYLLCFIWLLIKRNSCKSYASVIRNTRSLIGSPRLEIPKDDNESDAEQDAKQNTKLTFRNMFPLINKLRYFVFNYSSVFYLEYVILACFIDRTNPKSKNESSDKFIQKNAYVILNFMYQFGVFLSRSSLQYIKIPRIEIMTILQLTNFILLFSNIYLQIIPIELQVFMYLWVGVMGGLSYVNTMFMIYNTETIQQNQKELCSNIILIISDFVITLAGVSSMILSSTLFKDIK